MKMGTLYLNTRNKECSKSAKKIRKMGFVPGIMYGENLKNIMFEVGEIELNREMHNDSNSGLLNIELNGQKHDAIVKEIQKNVLTNEIMHIDLEEVDNNKMIESDVEVRFLNEESVGNRGGILQKNTNSVKVKCKADKIPKYIGVDLKNSMYSKVIRVEDLEIGEEITFLDNPKTIIALRTKPNYKEVNNDEDNDEAK
jgi:large subunit ribosomal protein L25